MSVLIIFGSAILEVITESFCNVIRGPFSIFGVSYSYHLFAIEESCSRQVHPENGL